MPRTLGLGEWYDFLLQVPYINVKELAKDDRECYMLCKEPYNGAFGEWASGESIHYPVRLPCSHHIGLQCLTKWMLSGRFHNQCPLDGVNLVTHVTQHVDLSEDRLFLKMLEGFRDPVNEARKKMLLNMLVRIIGGQGSLNARSDRIFILFELFLDHMIVNGHLTPGSGNRPRVIDFDAIRDEVDVEHILHHVPEGVRLVMVPPRRNLPIAQVPAVQHPRARQPYLRWIPQWLSNHLPRRPSPKAIDQMLLVYGWGFICSAFAALAIYFRVGSNDRGLAAIKELPQIALGLFCLGLLLFSLSVKK